MDRRTKSSARYRIITGFALLLAAFPLFSCSTYRTTPEEAIEIARTYTDLEWQPRSWHIRHGQDSKGIIVHTPDSTLSQYTSKEGYWHPGETAKGMPYKWGGFDTPQSFRHSLSEGKKAGDIASSYKVRGNDSVVSQESVGIDCSGFISRCWGLKRPVSHQ